MGLSHIDKDNNPTMVDVSEKKETIRNAIARCQVILPAEVLEALDGDEIIGPKGPVLQTAIIGATQAVKKTSDLIPFCHPLLLESIKFTSQIEENVLEIQCSVKNTGKTGVEMEALTGASLAALIVYDMCKALSHNIVIQETRLVQKTGGKSDIL